jgi:prefoldin subunit 4
LQEIELLIDDEDGVPYRIGDSFYTLSAVEATRRMEDEKASLEGEIATMDEGIEEIKDQLEGLKKRLYGKFGSSINLEK